MLATRPRCFPLQCTGSTWWRCDHAFEHLRATRPSAARVLDAQLVADLLSGSRGGAVIRRKFNPVRLSRLADNPPWSRTSFAPLPRLKSSRCSMLRSRARGLATERLFPVPRRHPAAGGAICYARCRYYQPQSFRVRMALAAKGSDDRSVAKAAARSWRAGDGHHQPEAADTPKARSRRCSVERATPWRVRTPNCLSPRTARRPVLPPISCPAPSALSDTPDALATRVRHLAVLERTAARGTAEMRIVEIADFAAHPKRGSTPSLSVNRRQKNEAVSEHLRTT